MPPFRMLALLVIFVQPVFATTRFTSDFADLVKLAEAVVQVQVTRTEVREIDSWLTTVVTVRVTENCKGSLEPGTELSIEYPGGEVGSRHMIVPGQPRLTVGKTALLLLARNRSGSWRVVSGDAGQVVFSTDDEGNAVARRVSGKFDYYIEDTASLSGYRAVSESIISAVTLAQIIAAETATGRPVLATVPPAAPQKFVQASAIVPAGPLQRKSANWAAFLLLFSATIAFLAIRTRRNALS